MRARLKVCCMASVEEAHLAARYGATAVGLVATMPSGPGPIADDLIAHIARNVPAGLETFLLTSRTAPQEVVDHVLACGTTTVQLVDAVPDDTYTLLRRHAPRVKIVQVIHVEDDRAIAQARRIESHVDALLLDSGRPTAAIKELGGTGRTHNWDISRRIVQSVARPVYLAGGLGPANVAEAIDRVAPWGIDLCSGVRTNGRLDEGKLAALVAAMR